MNPENSGRGEIVPTGNRALARATSPLARRALALAGEVRRGAVPLLPAYPKTLVIDCGQGVEMKFVRIPAGEFMMGSPEDEAGRQDDETLHHVKISKSFMMATAPVTRAQFAAFVADNGYKTYAEKKGFAHVLGSKGRSEKVEGASWRTPGIDQEDDHPVVQVSWYDADAFCKWLSKKQGRRCRLPTEAQWEYACRAGTQNAYPWGDNCDDGRGWVNVADQSYKEKFPNDSLYFSFSDGFIYTSPVGSFKKNNFGLYDMIGNVWEWCGDYSGPYPPGDATDPTGPSGGDRSSSRIARGASWGRGPEDCRSARRARGVRPSQRTAGLGFRVCLDAEPDQRPLEPIDAPVIPDPQPVILDPVGGADRGGFINSIGMKLVHIPAGEFMMGSPEGEAGREYYETLHHVKITKPFMMAATPVTRAQFAAFVADSGYKTDAEKVRKAKDVYNGRRATWRNSVIEQGDDHPVVWVTWNDATAFCDWLSRKEGKRYRLPAEAQWEYACRAGVQTAYPWGGDPDDGHGWANVADRSLKEWLPDDYRDEEFFSFSDGFIFTSPVGSFRKNNFDLYDMIGNVLEWCGDYFGLYPPGDAVDPVGPIVGNGYSSRVLRGGSWNRDPQYCRAASRNWNAPDARESDFGFRLCLDF